MAEIILKASHFTANWKHNFWGKNLSGFSWNDLSELQIHHGSTKNSICECTTVKALTICLLGGPPWQSVRSVGRNKSSVWGARGERRSHCVPCLHWPLISTYTHPTLSACSLLRLLRTSTKNPAARPTHGSPSKHHYSPIGRLALKEPNIHPTINDQLQLALSTLSNNRL